MSHVQFNASTFYLRHSIFKILLNCQWLKIFIDNCIWIECFSKCVSWKTGPLHCSMKRRFHSHINMRHCRYCFSLLKVWYSPHYILNKFTWNYCISNVPFETRSLRSLVVLESYWEFRKQRRNQTGVRRPKFCLYAYSFFKQVTLPLWGPVSTFRNKINCTNSF